MTLKEFEDYIETIHRYNARDAMISSLLETEGFITYTSKLTLAVASLLSTVMNDRDDWIGYWLWECNFGTEYEKLGGYTPNDEKIPMTTVEELYNWLMVGQYS
jgi:hypothetical protein